MLVFLYHNQLMIICFRMNLAKITEFFVCDVEGLTFLEVTLLKKEIQKVITLHIVIKYIFLTQIWFGERLKIRVVCRIFLIFNAF